MLDHAGSGTGLRTFLRGLVQAILDGPGFDDWRVTVAMPATDYHRRAMSWDGPAHPRLSLVFDGDASAERSPQEFRTWFERMVASHPADVAYFPFPYQAACPDLSIPMAATFHDFNHKRFDTWSKDVRANLERELPRWIDRCLAVVSSNFIANELVSYHPTAGGRVQVTPLGIPRALEAGTEEQWETFRLGKGIADGFVMTVGWLAPHKNQAVMLRAIPALRASGANITAVFVGPNSAQLCGYRDAHNPYPRHMIHLADRLGLTHGDDFIGLGQVGDVELEMLYSHAAALVMPTLYEAGSFPVREAMRLRCPVICSDIPPLVEDLERVGPDTALTFDPRDPEDLAHKVRTVLDNPDATRARVMRASVRVEIAFDWRATAAGYVRAFQQMMASASAAVA